MIFFQNKNLSNHFLLIIKDPLTHFLCLGAILFFLTSYFSEEKNTRTPQLIVTAQQIEQLHNKMRGLLKREPKTEEMQAAVNQYINEEVLLQEGIKLGVVEEDPIVRTRIAERVKFLLSDTTVVNEPNSEQLEIFFNDHKRIFAKPPRRSFTHVFLDPKNHPQLTTQYYSDIMNKLKLKNSAATLGDPFTNGQSYQQVDALTIQQSFGSSFAEKLFTSPINQWSGPIDSTYGIHFVLVSEELPAEEPTLEAIKDTVKAVYMKQQHEKQNQQAIEQLKAQYEIIIEPSVLIKSQ